MLRIEKNQDGFEYFRILANTMSKDSIKPVFNYLYKDGDKLVSSDGRRMAIVDLSNDMFTQFQGLDDGFYEVLKSTTKEIIIEKKDVDGNFPDYKRIIPTKFIDSCTVMGYCGHKKERAGMNQGKAFYRISQFNTLLNFMYVDQLLKELSGNVDVNFSGSVSPVLFDHDGVLQYVVMPIQIKEES